MMNFLWLFRRASCLALPDGMIQHGLSTSSVRETDPEAHLLEMSAQIDATYLSRARVVPDPI
jgi:hypothetical protein